MVRRILIIDDEPHICEALKDRLESMGYDVLIAHDGRTGLALIALEGKQVPIEGVLLDVHMPVMDGMEVLREVQSRHPGLPVLMMSAGPDRRVLDEAIRLGAKNYLMKPFDASSLKRLFEEVFPLGNCRP
jgi:DNA-binding response OmpR family regulator